MTWDEFLHYMGGVAKALPWLGATAAERRDRVTEIDLYGFYREWEQNLEGENPNIPMKEKQLDEARAWGNGARAVLRVVVIRPIEYYIGRPPVKLDAA